MTKTKAFDTIIPSPSFMISLVGVGVLVIVAIGIILLIKTSLSSKNQTEGFEVDERISTTLWVGLAVLALSMVGMILFRKKSA